MRAIVWVLIFVGIAGNNNAQEKVFTQSDFYLGWGYTRAWYSRSTIHFQNQNNTLNPVTGRVDNYDFVVHDVEAVDRPDFEQIKDVLNVTIPQFVFRVGYKINDKWDFEINYDHTKYVVRDFQKVHVTGRFNNSWVDNDTILDPNTFLHFEHTDGANFWLFNMVRKWNLSGNRKKLSATWMFKPGAGFVLPRTDVTLFGQRLNNNWKVAGWVAGIETGCRFAFFNKAYLELVGKTVYADYINAFVLGKGNGKASHHFFAAQVTATIGYQFGIKTARN